LNNSYFMNDTLIVLTFDEDETYTDHNNVFTILLGGAIPTSLHNTTDNTFYNHYSTITTVELNWGLPSLGRWDCNANVLELVANKTGYVNAVVDTTNLYFNSSYPGPLSDARYIPVWPVPDTTGNCAAGSILGSVVSTWGKSSGSYNYTNVYPYDAAADVNVGGSATYPSSSVAPSKTASSSASKTASSVATSSSSAAMVSRDSASVLSSVVAILISLFAL
jgi:acid phosphatase